MGALDAVADRIVHGARESFLRTLTNRLVSALRGLVSGTTSEARAANALDMASARVAEQAMGTWAEFRPKVTAEVVREVGQALRQRDETLQRDLVGATGADGPWGLTNRARNDLAEATRGVREVVGRQNVAGMTEADRAASKAAAAESMQGAADAHHAARAWYEVAGAAVTRVDMGDDPESVLRDAVAELARRGLETVDYKSGRSTTVDAAVRRHIDSQLNQAANDMAIRQCEEWGVGLVMVDAHWGARPSHAAWQGKAYSLHGATEVDGVTYEDLYEATGYQGRNGWPLGAQLAGVNCRHRIYPYIPGESVIPGTSEDEVAAYEKKYGMTSGEYYEATQRQRSLERELRSAKREAAFLEDEGLDATAQRYRIGDLQRRLREHCRRTGLERDPSRERAYGVSHQPRGLSSRSKASLARTMPVNKDDAASFNEYDKRRKTYAAHLEDTAKTTIDARIIDDKSYRRKVLGVTDERLGEMLADDMRRALHHRSGTRGEDLYAYDATSCTRLGSVTNSRLYSEVRPSRKMIQRIAKAVADGHEVVIMHNHPGSSLPSVADINSLARTGATYGIIAAHDGSIYRFSIVGDPAPGYNLSQENWDLAYARRIGSGEARALRSLESIFGVRVEHIA